MNKSKNIFMFKLTYNICKCESIQREFMNVLIKKFLNVFSLCKIYVHFFKN